MVHSALDTPFFTKGVNPFIKLVLCVVLSIILMIVDSKINLLSTLRSNIANILYPTQQIISVVPKTIDKINSYSRNHIDIIEENRNIHEQLTYSSIDSYKAIKLYKENTQLKNLLNIKQNSKTPLLATEILYSSNNPFIHRLIINKGSNDNVQIGQPLINEYGVLGQITRVFNTYSEVTKIGENKIMVPAQDSRSGIRGIISGENGKIYFKFITYGADIQINDIIITSGLDGVYPEGLAIAKVTKLLGKTQDGFINIECSLSSNITDKPYAMIILNKPLNMDIIQEINKELSNNASLSYIKNKHNK